jgi:2,3-bisphosphoglycerate-dependent phosphoglycerate mutase
VADPYTAPMQRLPVLDLVLVRHADPVPSGTPDYDEQERPLSDEGRHQAEELADELEPYQLHGIYSSPYPRAVQTVEPIARRRGLKVQLLDDMRERLLSPAALPGWRGHLERSFADDDYAVTGGETSRDAQRRGMGMLDLLRARHLNGGRILVASHSALITLILRALGPDVGYAFWEAMPYPAVYWLQHDGGAWRVMGGYGFSVADATG